MGKTHTISLTGLASIVAAAAFTSSTAFAEPSFTATYGNNNATLTLDVHNQAANDLEKIGCISVSGFTLETKPTGWGANGCATATFDFLGNGSFSFSPNGTASSTITVNYTDGNGPHPVSVFAGGFVEPTPDPTPPDPIPPDPTPPVTPPSGPTIETLVADAGSNFTVMDTDGLSGETFSLDGCDSQGSIARYEWSNSDGDILGSTCEISVSATDGFNSYTLQVTGTTGETDSDSIEVMLEGPVIPEQTSTVYDSSSRLVAVECANIISNHKNLLPDEQGRPPQLSLEFVYLPKEKSLHLVSFALFTESQEGCSDRVGYAVDPVTKKLISIDYATSSLVVKGDATGKVYSIFTRSAPNSPSLEYIRAFNRLHVALTSKYEDITDHSGDFNGTIMSSGAEFELPTYTTGADVMVLMDSTTDGVENGTEYFIKKSGATVAIDSMPLGEVFELRALPVNAHYHINVSDSSELRESDPLTLYVQSN